MFEDRIKNVYKDLESTEGGEVANQVRARLKVLLKQLIDRQGIDEGHAQNLATFLDVMELKLQHLGLSALPRLKWKEDVGLNLDTAPQKIMDASIAIANAKGSKNASRIGWGSVAIAALALITAGAGSYYAWLQATVAVENRNAEHERIARSDQRRLEKEIDRLTRSLTAVKEAAKTNSKG